MLILNLTAVAREAVRIRGELSPEDPVWEGVGVTLAEPLAVDVEARAVGEGILVRGEMATRVSSECRRCLSPVSLRIRDQVDLLYEELDEAEAEELGGEVYALPERGDQLDLSEALREQLVLRIPAYVVCADTCRGLCPQCGAELNRTTCECTPERASGPWDALRDIEFE